MFFTALIPWFLLVILAIINGFIRQKFIFPKVGEQKAHVIGTIIFLILQFILIFVYVKISLIRESSILLEVGVFCVILTVLFEFGFGHYIMKHPWSKLLADYNIFKGRIWLLVLINNIFAPVFSGYLIR